MGSLHERNPSLWVATTGEAGYPALSPADLPLRADVVVVGGGITGLTTARLLVEEGADVVVLEAGPLCAGATGYTTAKVTSLHGRTYAELVDRWGPDRARAYGEANEWAIAEVARLVAADGTDCDLERRAHVVYTTDPAQVSSLEREAEVAAELGLPVVPGPAKVTPAIATSTAAGPRPACELPFEVEAAVRFEDQAQLHPRRYCLGLAEAIVAGGGRVFERARVHRIERDPATADHVAHTDHGEVRAGAVVVATHLPMGRMGAYFARTKALRSYAIAVEVPGDRPEAMYLGVDEPTRSLRPAGDLLIVGGEGHPVGDRHDTREHYANLEAWAALHFGATRVVHRWSAQDWASGDGVPYIGRMAGHDDGVFVATAFKKWGLTHGTVAGRIITDLIGGRESPWLEVFDATRIAPRQNLKGIVDESLHTLRHFVGDRLAALRPAGGVDDLAAGEGTVVRVDGHPVAAFRDDDGTLHEVSALCTHLGCHVSFNPAERSWDCPCHGSRFAVDGAVLEGPATEPLDPRPAG